MGSVTATCDSCGGSFEAQRRTARYCSTKCKSRGQRTRDKAPKRPAKRAAKKAVAKKATPAKKTAASRGSRSSSSAIDRHGLVVAVTKQLEDADKLDTVNGQIALQLARRFANPNESGPAALADKLDQRLAAALGTKPDGPDESTEPDDEVTAARKAREEAREKAGRA